MYLYFAVTHDRRVDAFYNNQFCKWQSIVIINTVLLNVQITRVKACYNVIKLIIQYFITSCIIKKA